MASNKRIIEQLFPDGKLPPAKYDYTAAELAAVPAIIFPKFRQLSLEVRIMVFRCNPKKVLIEVMYSQAQQQFRPSIIRNPTSHTEATYELSVNTKLHPIHFTPVTGPHHRDGVVPVMIRSTDVVYLRNIHKLDTYRFLELEGNHTIKNLAMDANLENLVGFRHSGNHGKGKDHLHGAVRLISELRNLKNLYILDGSTYNQENKFLRIRKSAEEFLQLTYKLYWSKLRRGRNKLHLDNHLGVLVQPYRYDSLAHKVIIEERDYNKGVARHILKVIREEATRGWSKSALNVIFRQIRRVPATFSWVDSEEDACDRAFAQLSRDWSEAFGMDFSEIKRVDRRDPENLSKSIVKWEKLFPTEDSDAKALARSGANADGKVGEDKVVRDDENNGDDDSRASGVMRVRGRVEKLMRRRPRTANHDHNDE